MAVKEALDKISERHSDVIGAIVTSDGRYYHNLEAPYDMVSVNELMDLFAEMLGQTDLLADEGFEFSELMIDFPGHSFIVRKIDDDGLLAVLAPRLPRGHLIKLQVGLALFGKSVTKALVAEAEEAAAVEEATVESEYPELPEVVRPAVPSDFDYGGRPVSRPRKGFRGARSFYTKAVDAVSDVTERQNEEEVQEAVVEPGTTEDGVPLRPDGTPMKKKMYRGQVYYE